MAFLQRMFGREKIFSETEEQEFVESMMDVANPEKFVPFVNSQWETIFAKLPPYMTQYAESTKRSWFVQGWRDIVREYTKRTSDHTSISDEQSSTTTLKALQAFVGSCASDSKVAADICQYISSTSLDLSTGGECLC